MQPMQHSFNPNIGCNVRQCKYNSKAANCCTLPQIDVMQENEDPVSEHGTCCHSFECK